MKVTKTTTPAATPEVVAARPGKIKTMSVEPQAAEKVAATQSPSPKVAPDAVKKASSSGESSKLGLFPEGGSSSVEGATIQGGTQFSIGDPHETTGDGMKFDNMEVGDFVKVRSALGDFEVQTRHEPWSKNAQTTVNTAVGVKLNGQGDQVVVNAAGEVTFNGKSVEVKPGEPFEIPGGGRVEREGDTLVMTSAAGDKVSVLDRGEYLDMRVDACPERRDGDITGSLGRLDSDTDFRNDLVDREGKEMSDVAAFIEEWRAREGESMFGAGSAAAPGEDEAPAAGEVPPSGAADPAAGGAPEEVAAPGEDEATANPLAEVLKKIQALLTQLQPSAAAPEAAASEPVTEGAEAAPEQGRDKVGKQGAEQKAEPGSKLAEVLALIAGLIRQMEEAAAARQANEQAAATLAALP